MVNKRYSCIAVSCLFIIALAGICSGCFTAPTSVGPPNLDYSLLGPHDSAILIYVDPALGVGSYSLSKMEKMRSFSVVVNPGNRASEMLVNWTGTTQPQQYQMIVPNGSYTLHVVGEKYPGIKADILPFTVSLNDLAITYKIRPATDKEKIAGGIGLGNEAYTLEETAQVKIR